jgi:hypothetical protein
MEDPQDQDLIQVTTFTGMTTEQLADVIADAVMFRLPSNREYGDACGHIADWLARDDRSQCLDEYLLDEVGDLSATALTALFHVLGSTLDVMDSTADWWQKQRDVFYARD